MVPLRPALVALATFVALAAFAPAAALAAPSPKDKADARAFAAEARKAVKDKRWSDAIAGFLTADGLDPSPAIEIDLAQAEISAGKLAEAAKVLTAITAGSDAAAKKGREAAKKALDDLKPRIPRVKVTVTGPTAKVSVIVDGVDADASGEILVNPGAHTVGASADGWNPAEKDVALAEGAHQTVELTLTTATTAPPPQETSGSRVPGIIVASAGGAVILVGAVFGGLAFSATSSARAQCVADVCQPSAAGDISRSKTFGDVSTGLFIAGGAVAATGVILAIIAPGGGGGGKKKKDARLVPWVGPDRVGLAGAF